MADRAEMWKLEWWAGGSGESLGAFNRELIEGDEDAHTRLMQLAVDQLLSNRTNRVPHGKRRRVAAWLRLHPVDNGTKDKDWQHVDRLQAWRLVDGVWCEAKWTITSPDIEVSVYAPSTKAETI